MYLHGMMHTDALFCSNRISSIRMEQDTRCRVTLHAVWILLTCLFSKPNNTNLSPFHTDVFICLRHSFLSLLLLVCQEFTNTTTAAVYKWPSWKDITVKVIDQGHQKACLCVLFELQLLNVLVSRAEVDCVVGSRSYRSCFLFSLDAVRFPAIYVYNMSTDGDSRW